MTLDEAFKELTLNQPEWYKATGMSEEQGGMLYKSFTQNNARIEDVRAVLEASGYSRTESWSTKAGQIQEQPVTPSPSAAEAALLKQNDTPLGSPQK